MVAVVPDELVGSEAVVEEVVEMVAEVFCLEKRPICFDVSKVPVFCF